MRKGEFTETLTRNFLLPKPKNIASVIKDYHFSTSNYFSLPISLTVLNIQINTIEVSQFHTYLFIKLKMIKRSCFQLLTDTELLWRSLPQRDLTVIQWKLTNRQFGCQNEKHKTFSAICLNGRCMPCKISSLNHPICLPCTGILTVTEQS